MTKKIRFYCRDGRWYADLPEYITAGGTEEECEMVLGADTWLDNISDGEDNVLLEISDHTKFDNQLVLLESDDDGAAYLINETYPIWLCNVTKFVFGQFPKTMYYKILKSLT